MIIKHNGVYHIEKKSHYNEEDEARFDKRYGKGSWIYTEAICTGLCPDCGYGEPMVVCRYKDGRCIRPSKRESK